MSEFLINVLIISGIGAFLALLLELADSYIADYGECRIQINQKKEMEVKGGIPLLFSLAEEGIFIPSACGGKGTCAYCKVKVLEGGGPVLPTETPYLTEDEVREDIRLSCQVKVRNDIAIEIPEELFQIHEFEIQVDKIVDLTHQVKGITFTIPATEEGITFKPGQYVQLEVPKYKLSEVSEFRAFSVASPPQESYRVELFVGRVVKGIVSTYIHDYLKVGDRLTMRGPFGDFFYRESKRDILMIATGTGLAPILSILRYFQREKIDQKATLFFGTRNMRDLYCTEELKILEKELNQFTFIPTLSREPEDSPWKGERGRVTDQIEKRITENADLDVYICGNSEMVESCLEVLDKKGISLSHIHFDKFT